MLTIMILRLLRALQLLRNPVLRSTVTTKWQLLRGGSSTPPSIPRAQLFTNLIKESEANKKPFTNNLPVRPRRFLSDDTSIRIDTEKFYPLLKQDRKIFTRPKIDTGEAAREIVTENMDLSAYPFDKNSQITVGDLHANGQKFMMLLIKSNALIISEHDYYLFNAIYHKSIDELVAEDLDTFKSILTRAKVFEVRKDMLIRLGGDEFCDRGNNDYFVLKILEKIGIEHLPSEILFSNHGWEFIKVYEQGIMDHKSYLETTGYGKSLTNLRKLIEKKLVTEEEVMEIIKNYYQPNLKVISYSLDESQNILTIYSHAPIGINTIKKLAENFKIEYADVTPYELSKTIDQINAKFSKAVMQNKVMETFGTDLKTHMGNLISLNYPLSRTIFSRGYHEFDLPEKELNGFKLHWVHCHDGEGEVEREFTDFVTNLDNLSGKGETNVKSKFSFLFSHDKRLLEKKPATSNNDTPSEITKVTP